MTPNEIAGAINQASKATDRWMFVAMLALLIFFGWCVIKWLIRQLELQRISYQALITSSVEKYEKLSLSLMEMNERVIQVIEANAKAITDVSHKVGQCPVNERALKIIEGGKRRDE